MVLAGFDLADVSGQFLQKPSLAEKFLTEVMGENTVQYLAQDQYYGLSSLYYSIQALINTGNVDSAQFRAVYGCHSALYYSYWSRRVSVSEAEVPSELLYAQRGGSGSGIYGNYLCGRS